MFPVMQSVLEQEVKLVPLDPDNLDHTQFMYAVRTHPEVAKQLLQHPPSDFDSHVAYLRAKECIGDKKFFLISSGEDLCGYCQVSVQNNALELGWALHPQWWGKGIGKYSVLLFVQFLKNLEFAKGKVFTLVVKKSNEKAISIYKKCGFSIVDEAEHLEFVMRYTS